MAYLYISYDTANAALARQIKNELEAEGLNTWLDESGSGVSQAERALLIEGVIASSAGIIEVAGDGIPGERIAQETAYARSIGRPVFRCYGGDDLEKLLPRLRAVVGSSPDSVITLPQPLQSDALEEVVGEVRINPLILLIGGVVSAVILVAALAVLLFSRPPRLAEFIPEAVTGVSPPATSAATETAAADAALPRPALVSAHTATSTATPTEPTRTPSLTAAFTATRTVAAQPTEPPTPTPSPSPTVTPFPTSTPSSTPPPTNTSIPATSIQNGTAAPTPLPVGYDNRTWQISEDVRNGIEIVFVPSGCFVPPAFLPREASDNTVCYEAFWLSKTEITNAQYAECVLAGACTPPSDFSSATRSSYYDNPLFASHPVLNVTYFQAADFAEWVGGSMPTYGQWLYAAQGPSNWLYPWGDLTLDQTRLNFNNFMGDTTRAGSYPAGASWVGALDMAGNAAEWTVTVEDQLAAYGAGGSWAAEPTGIRPEIGQPEDMLSAISTLGFRVLFYPHNRTP